MPAAGTPIRQGVDLEAAAALDQDSGRAARAGEMVMDARSADSISPADDRFHISA
jgi:hypothetical protein